MRKIRLNYLSLAVLIVTAMWVAACAPAATAVTATAQPTQAPMATDTPVPPTATVEPPTATVEPSATVQPTNAIVSVGTDIHQKLPAGDAARGALLVETLTCTKCHVGDQADGPLWAADAGQGIPGIATRAETTLKAANYKGHATSAQEYLFESIVDPNVYIVPGNAVSPGVSAMPSDFTPKISAQMMADIIAYLETIK